MVEEVLTLQCIRNVVVVFFFGVSSSFTEKESTKWEIYLPFFEAFLLGFRLQGSPTFLEEKIIGNSVFSLSVDDGSEIRRKSPVEMVSVSQIAIFKGTWPWFLEMYPVTLLSGAVGFRLPRMRIDLLAPKRFPG